jgi:hypothetical protein
VGGAVGVECLPEVTAELAGAALALRLAGGGRDEELGVDELLAVRDVVSLAASSVEGGTPALPLSQWATTCSAATALTGPNAEGSMMMDIVFSLSRRRRP